MWVVIRGRGKLSTSRIFEALKNHKSLEIIHDLDFYWIE